MTNLKIQTSDLIENTNVRFPVCIAIETSEKIMDNVSTEIAVRKTLSGFLDYINKNSHLKNSVDFCVVCYSDKAIVTRPFGLVGESQIDLPILEGEPNFENLFKLLIREQRIRINDYNNQNVGFYPPSYCIISSGKSSVYPEKEISQLRHWDSTGQISIFPAIFETGEKEAEILSELTYDGVVYSVDEINISDFFVLFGKNIEKLSMSTIYAADNLRKRALGLVRV